MFTKYPRFARLFFMFCERVERCGCVSTHSCTHINTMLTCSNPKCRTAKLEPNQQWLKNPEPQFPNFVLNEVDSQSVMHHFYSQQRAVVKLISKYGNYDVLQEIR